MVVSKTCELQLIVVSNFPTKTFLIFYKSSHSFGSCTAATSTQDKLPYLFLSRLLKVQDQLCQPFQWFLKALHNEIQHQVLMTFSLYTMLRFVLRVTKWSIFKVNSSTTLWIINCYFFNLIFGSLHQWLPLLILKWFSFHFLCTTTKIIIAVPQRNGGNHVWSRDYYKTITQLIIRI